jgi:hypothetical protein
MRLDGHALSADAFASSKRFAIFRPARRVSESTWLVTVAWLVAVIQQPITSLKQSSKHWPACSAG